jgi:hypothetical protein
MLAAGFRNPPCGSACVYDASGGEVKKSKEKPCDYLGVTKCVDKVQ